MESPIAAASFIIKAIANPGGVIPTNSNVQLNETDGSRFLKRDRPYV
jgi:hypothetical protein